MVITAEITSSPVTFPSSSCLRTPIGIKFVKAAYRSRGRLVTYRSLRSSRSICTLIGRQVTQTRQKRKDVPDAPALSVSPQSPSPAMLSICVISGSATIRFLHARSIASVNALESGKASGCGRLICSVVKEDGTAAVDTALEGGNFEDHFHPGALVSSSRSESSRSFEGADESWEGGSKSSVMENPGMFKLVCAIG